MSETQSEQRYFRSGELAEKLNLSRQTLRMWRIEGTGPSYVQLPGGSVRYSESAVDEWVEASSPHRPGVELDDSISQMSGKTRFIDADAALYFAHVRCTASALSNKGSATADEVRPKFFELGRILVVACGEPPDDELYNKLREDTRVIFHGYDLRAHEQMWQVFESGISLELAIAAARHHRIEHLVTLRSPELSIPEGVIGDE